MIGWEALAGADTRDVLLVGNGPSRRDPEAVEIQRAWKGSLIGCNAYWRDAPRAPDYLACFDREQVHAAAEYAKNGENRTCVVAPPATWNTVGWAPGLGESMGDLAVVTTPNIVATALHHAADPGFVVGSGALGNFAGHLAFQLAWLLGSKLIYLLGVDCAGRLSPGGEVQLSAVDPAVRGYTSALAPKAECIALPDGSWRPSGWGFSVDLWRALVAAAARAGVRVYRARPGGALDFIEVRAPGSDH